MNSKANGQSRVFILKSFGSAAKHFTRDGVIAFLKSGITKAENASRESAYPFDTDNWHQAADFSAFSVSYDSDAQEAATATKDKKTKQAQRILSRLTKKTGANDLYL
jgi:ribose 1,5-bisphosphokinase PhnN